MAHCHTMKMALLCKLPMVSLAAFAAMPASAQLSGSNRAPIKPAVTDAKDSDIIVTGQRGSYVNDKASSATKTDTPLLETPQAVSVVNRDFIDAIQATTVVEALRYTAGVSPPAFGRLPFQDGQLRGFGTSNASFYDGTRLTTVNFGASQEPYGLEQIEVVKGAASVLYGTVGPGGIINAISRRPTAQRQGELLVSAGTLDLRQIAGDISGAISGDGRLQARLTGLYRKQDDVFDFAYNNRTYVAPALSFKPSDRTEVTLLGFYQYDTYLRGGEFPAVGTILPNANGKIPRTRFTGEPDNGADRFTSTYAKLIVKQRVGDDIELRVNAGFKGYDLDSRLVSNAGLRADQRTINRAASFSHINSDIYQVDSSALFHFTTAGISHTAIVGIDYYENDDLSRRPNATIAPLDIFAPVYGAKPVFGVGQALDTKTDLGQLGYYAQDQIKIAGRFILVGGFRHDHVEQTSLNNLNRTSIGSTDNQVTGKVGALVLVPGGLAPYVSYGESFVPNAGTDFAGNSFMPSLGKTKEAGIKFESKNGRIVASAALFEIKQTNVLTPDPVNAGFSVQTGEQRHRGAEAEINAAVTPSWSVVATISRLNPIITRSNSAGVQGKRPVNVPRNAATLFSTYSFRKGPMTGLSLSGGLRYEGNKAGDALNSFFTPSYVATDAALAYQRSGWRLAVNVSNLFDKTYFVSARGINNVRYGDPRLVKASVGYRF